MIRTRVVVLYVLCLTLFGCAPHWTRPNTTPQQVSIDDVQCFGEAQAKTPEVTIIGGAAGSTQAWGRARLVRSYYKDCMRALGYQDEFIGTSKKPDADYKMKDTGIVYQKKQSDVDLLAEKAVNKHITSQAAPIVEPTEHATRTVGKEADRSGAVERKNQPKGLTIAMGARPSVSTAKEIRKGDRFIADSNGTVLDTSTNLMWAVKDNGRDIDWANAKSYCENYRGGDYTDWRMPTLDELAGFYDANKSRPGACNRSYSIHVATELIDITCFIPWASETRGSDAAYFNFGNGERYWGLQSYTGNKRALPVRSGK